MRPISLWACSQRSESRSKSRFGLWFWPLPDLKAWYTLCESGFWNAEKRAFWIVIRLESLILRTCESKALSECDSCVLILQMRAEAMHGSISAVGTKYYLAVRRPCSWLGRQLQCLWMHIVHITNPIKKRIAIRNGFRNVIRSFVNRPSVRTVLSPNWLHVDLSLTNQNGVTTDSACWILCKWGVRFNFD